MNHTRDSYLVARMRTSDDGWQDFLDRYQPRIFQFARSRGLQDADAQDVTQNVLVHICRALPDFKVDPNRGTFWDWIATIVHREILRHLYAMRRVRLTNNREALERHIATQSSRLTRSTRIVQQIYELAICEARLTSRRRDWVIFRAIWLRNESPKLVARREGQSVQWVYRAKFRVLKRVRFAVRCLTENSALSDTELSAC